MMLCYVSLQNSMHSFLCVHSNGFHNRLPVPLSAVQVPQMNARMPLPISDPNPFWPSHLEMGMPLLNCVRCDYTCQTTELLLEHLRRIHPDTLTVGGQMRQTLLSPDIVSDSLSDQSIINSLSDETENKEIITQRPKSQPKRWTPSDQQVLPAYQPH